MDFLGNHIEALIFCAPKAIKTEEIQSCLSEMFEAEVPLEDIEKGLEAISEKYASDDYPFEVVKSGGGYQFLTKPAYQASIGILLKQQSKRRLSASAMETLSIIAYKQPVTKSEVEQIRGVNCDYSVQKLLEKELLEIKGKSDAVGRPLLYGTSDKFMDYFGINDLKELPTPKDFATADNEIGDSEPEDQPTIEEE
ncbi:MAG: SMC-Scp complex subunit ScpB [Cytophagia bacterium]|nr:SMC-Scp complex subunit ScpB [Cytophagia bacterium]